MSIISIPNTFSAGAVIIASQHNSNFSTIYSDYNGNIDNTNIVAAAGITYSKLTLTGGIVNADVNASAAIVASKLNLTTASAIGTTSPAAGKFTTLEATSTLKLGTTNQGDIIYDNGTSLVRLTPGTSGQALITGGAGANPAWGSGAGTSFISKTIVSTAATTGNIAITNTNYYQVFFNFTTFSASDTFLFRFNADNTAAYDYAFDGRTSGGAITGGAAGATSITMGTAFLNSGSNAQFSGNLTIFPELSVNSIYMTGRVMYYNNAASLVTFVDISGNWNIGSAATSFSLFTSGGATFSGNVYLYKNSLS